MSFPLSIVIWDYDPGRIAGNRPQPFTLALRELNLRGIWCPACPKLPLMSREGACRPGTRP